MKTIYKKLVSFQDAARQGNISATKELETFKAKCREKADAIVAVSRKFFIPLDYPGLINWRSTRLKCQTGDLFAERPEKRRRREEQMSKSLNYITVPVTHSLSSELLNESSVCIWSPRGARKMSPMLSLIFALISRNR